jgi:hypothetical protein
MIFSLLACIYITAVCWSWGMLLTFCVRTLMKGEALLALDFAITCFCGLALISVTAGFLSLLLPLGGLLPQLLFLLPAVSIFLRRETREQLARQVSGSFSLLSPALLLSLVVALVASLIINAGEIIHPDTLHYHAQCIQWIEANKVIPGLVNLSYHYGLQSSWFTASALFLFKFTDHNAPGFLGITIITWFIIFLHEKMNRLIRVQTATAGTVMQALGWLLLFIFSFWSFTMIRGTLTSASPDFITAMYIWLAFYLFIQLHHTNSRRSLLLFMLFIALFSVSIKLSAAPAALFAGIIYIVYSKRNKRSLAFAALIAIFTLTPFIARNIITSGYPLFPMTFPDIIHADWKAPDTIMAAQRNHIKAYARVGDETTLYADEEVVNMPAAQWVPIWWQNRSPANKIILAALAALLLAHLLLFKKTRWKDHLYLLYVLIASAAGIVLWAVQAPDPRFGFGYIIPAIAVLLYMLPPDKVAESLVNRRIIYWGLMLFSTALACYGSYRAFYFFETKNLVKPAGITPVTFEKLNCHGMTFHKPHLDQCGSTELPCTYYPCSQFLPRGRNISDGFKPGVR